MKKKLLFALALSLQFVSFSQQGDGGSPKVVSFQKIEKTIDHRFFPQPDIAALQTEDAETAVKGDGPWRFGFNNETNLNMDNAGTWVNLADGGKIWLLQVTCENALTVNLTFDDLTIPEGNELFVYNPDKSFILGKFTAYHLYEKQLGTELVPGNSAIIEYYIPAANTALEASLMLSTVTHGYRTAEEFQEKAFNSSGSCNMNVNCPDGASWVNERNSTVMLVSGSNGFCTGALVNNTLNDGKPYVLTANHCYSNPTNWIFRFNWQSENCAQPTTSPTFTSLSGAVLRSRRTPTDFCLVEITGGLINNTVPISFSPYFAGWDHSNSIPSSTVCIHHPSGDIKKIAFDDAAPVISQGMGSSEANSTWTVQWDRNTTTEPGSSGSPLFDNNHRIIGQLWGGGASCTNLNSPDYYGRFSSSWEPTGSNSTNQLKFWLDPSNSGFDFINGFNPAGPPLANDAGLQNATGVSGTFCSSEVTPQITIANNGTATLTSATINYGYDGVNNLVYNWTGSLSQYQTAVITLPLANLTNGNHTFQAVVNNPNNITDSNTNNNSVSSSFTSIVNGQFVDLNIVLDCYGSEITWEITSSNGSTVYHTGGPYSDSQNGGQVINQSVCLTGGCYKFKIFDSYGDGLTSQGCPNNGEFAMTNSLNDTLAQISPANANFGDSTSIPFCISGVGIGENELASFWSIYPNPSNQYITINLNKFAGENTIQFVTTTGQVVRTFTTSDAMATIDVSTFAKGVYFVTLQTELGNTTKRLVIK
jgi:V8-like Glu-specific endopeptidase